MNRTKKKIITYSILLILAVLLTVYLIIPFTNVTIGRIYMIKYRQNEGIWISADHSAYIDMNNKQGKVLIDGKIHSIEFWFYPSSPGADVWEKPNPNHESSDIIYTHWHIKYRKDHFTITVIDSNFMKKGTKLTFHRAENDTLPEGFLE